MTTIKPLNMSTTVPLPQSRYSCLCQNVVISKMFCSGFKLSVASEMEKANNSLLKWQVQMLCMYLRTVEWLSAQLH